MTSGSVMVEGLGVGQNEQNDGSEDDLKNQVDTRGVFSISPYR